MRIRGATNSNGTTICIVYAETTITQTLIYQLALADFEK